jgi:diaminopimelate epimerase
MRVAFSKYTACGNDFILVNDEQTESVDVRRMCDRRFGVGADGFVRVRRSATHAFEMVYYNCDGNISTLCGNGARCAVRCAIAQGLHDGADRCMFLAADGEHAALYNASTELVSVRFGDFDRLAVKRLQNNAAFVDVGSPHHLQFGDIPDTDTARCDGRSIRHTYGASGSNVNFVSVVNETRLRVRTFERGVEDLTLACGSGCVSAVVAHCVVNAPHLRGPLTVQCDVDGGTLEVSLSLDESQLRDVWLIGPAVKVFEGIYIVS